MGERVFDVAVVGSGFAGSLVAWGLQRRGLRTVVIERGSHPRRALGESTTPLANLALERLALRLESRELYDLACWARWRRTHPELAMGRKRGFTFYRLDTEMAYDDRLLVAASPTDEVADVQWWRADVDAYLLARAREAGAAYYDHTTIDALAREGDEWSLQGKRSLGAAGASSAVRLRARFLVDASGGGGFCARHLGLWEQRRQPRLATELIGAHFDGLSNLDAAAAAGGGEDPYPQDWSAVHHVIDEGWMYQLRFEQQPTSVGFVLPRQVERGGSRVIGPDERFSSLVARYPLLRRQFRDAKRNGAWWTSEQLAFRLARCVGEGWMLLPQAFAFFDPLYSTGIAWSLVAVERVLDLFEEGQPGGVELQRYASLLEAEADLIEQLVLTSYQAMTADSQNGSRRASCGGSLGGSLDLLTLTSRLYFVAASYHETRQRVCDEGQALPGAAASASGMPGTWAWEGLLGATDPVVVQALRRWPRQIEAKASAPDALADWLVAQLSVRDVAGLLVDPHRRLVPAEIERVLSSGPLLGLEPSQVRARRQRLLSPDWGRRAVDL